MTLTIKQYTVLPQISSVTMETNIRLKSILKQKKKVQKANIQVIAIISLIIGAYINLKSNSEKVLMISAKCL